MDCNGSFARSQRSVMADCFIASTGLSVFGCPLSISQPPIVSVDSTVVAGQMWLLRTVRFGRPNSQLAIAARHPRDR